MISRAHSGAAGSDSSEPSGSLVSTVDVGAPMFPERAFISCLFPVIQGYRVQLVVSKTRVCNGDDAAKDSTPQGKPINRLIMSRSWYMHCLRVEFLFVLGVESPSLQSLLRTVSNRGAILRMDIGLCIGMTFWPLAALAKPETFTELRRLRPSLSRQGGGGRMTLSPPWRCVSCKRSGECQDHPTTLN